jgi:hypothetical protein
VKRIVKIVIIVLAVVFVAIQFYRPDRTLPPENPAETLEASTKVPDDVDMILNRSCADCHSNRTTYPWYSNVSPFSWFLANHIAEGRRELNLSVWNTYEIKKKTRTLGDICEQVEDGEMPLPSYLWIHWDAKLKPGEAKILCDWTETEKNRLEDSDQ